jgi:ABC-2 type transport system ATP-binding protein
VADLVVDYPDVRAVNGISFELSPGSITAFLGPNGAGKTTTIEVCEGLRRPTSGTVEIFGHDPRNLAAGDRARMGVMLQSGGIPTSARAVEFVKHVASLYANPLDVNALCERLGLHALGRTSYRRMSGGQKQTVALAAAIVGRPELIILDEPTAGLDPQARLNTWELLAELKAAGVTILLSTHYMEEAQAVADHVLIADQGVLVAQAPLHELLSDDQGQLEISTASTVDTTALQSVLGPSFQVSQRLNSVFVAGDITDEVHRLAVEWCSTHGVIISGLQTNQQTLEDVFFELTGRGLQ